MSLRALWKPFLQTLRRWRRSRLQRTFEWQFLPAYWKLRRRRELNRLKIGNRVFHLKDSLRSRRKAASALRSMLRGIIKPVLLSISLVLLLELVGFLAAKYGGLLGPLLPEWVSRFASGVNQNIKPDPTIYVTLFSTFAQVAGAFLALYFTAVSVVISTVYARVQGDVRSILLRDKFSNGYVNLVAMLGAMATILLVGLALKRQPNVLNLAAVALLGIAAIFSFVQLGSRIFYFFDPTRLVGELSSDLVNWVRSATPRGHRWQDAAFQSLYQEQAEGVLDTYRNIVLLANREVHLQSNALVGLANDAFMLLRYYAREKSSIPSDSQWFRRTNEHQDWFNVSGTDLYTALNTGTGLRAEIVPDLMWVETEIEETVVFMLDGLFSRRDLQSAYSFSNYAHHTLGSLAQSFAVDEALHLFRKLAPPLRQQAQTAELKGIETEEGLLKLNYALGLTDIYGLGFTKILLGLSRRLEKVTAESLGKMVAELKWDDPRSLYAGGLPRSVVKQIEKLASQLEFERAVEGRLITPLWYRQQTVALAFVHFIEKSCRDLLGELERAIADEAESLVNEKRSVFAAQLIERGLEACNKFAYHFHTAKECYESLATLQRVKDDFPWPEIEWKDHYDRIRKVRERLVTALGKIVPDLMKLPKSKHFPEYFGYAYALISHECYVLMTEGDEERFKQLFPVFFASGWEAFNQLNASTQYADPEVSFTYAAQPVGDLLDLSGYAYIFTDLDGKNFREQVDKLWNAHFEGVKDPKAAANRLALIARVQGAALSYHFTRDEMRTAWKQSLERLLRDRGLLDRMPSSSRHPYLREDESRHPSKIIREMIGGDMLHYGARDVFLSEYVMQRFGVEDFEQLYKAARFYRRMRRSDSGDEENDDQQGRKTA
jgi:hypothetical protein